MLPSCLLMAGSNQTMTDPRKPLNSPEPGQRRPRPVLALLAGLGVIIIISLVWLSFRGTPPPSVSKKVEDAPPALTKAGPMEPAIPTVAAAPSAAADSTAALNSQLAQVLSGIREANQKKDLSQLLSYYSPNFPQLTRRAQSISKTWKIYNYPKMEFEMSEAKLLDAHTATARVTWEVEAQNISTQKSKNISRNYLLKFTKESGKWRISGLEETD